MMLLVKRVVSSAQPYFKVWLNIKIALRTQIFLRTLQESANWVVFKKCEVSSDGTLEISPPS